MDPIKILKRSWHILWNYRILWVFGLLIALASGGSGGSHGNNYSTSGEEWQRYEQTVPGSMRESFQQAFEELKTVFENGLPSAGISAQEINALMWIGVALLALALLIGLVFIIARFVSETAIIKMVDRYEQTGEKVGLRQGFRWGWSRISWRLFLSNLLLHLPIIALVIVFVAAVLMTVIRFARQGEDVSSIVIVIGMSIVFVLVIVFLSVVVGFLRHFIWRAGVLEELGVRASFRRGWEVIRANWKDAGLMWLIMFGLGIAWIFVSLLAVVITLPLLIVTAIAGLIVASVPFFLAYGLSSLVLGSWLPWLVAGLVGLPIFMMVTLSPWWLLGSWQVVFTSTVWTLTYRELTALPFELPAAPAGEQELDI